MTKNKYKNIDSTRKTLNIILIQKTIITALVLLSYFFLDIKLNMKNEGFNICGLCFLYYFILVVFELIILEGKEERKNAKIIIYTNHLLENVHLFLYILNIPFFV